MGRDLARPVVSGLARGVDGLGPHWAISVGRRAIGVLGTGIDLCCPKENKKLFEKVLEEALLSANCPSVLIRARKFCGVTLGVLIVEGKQYSGSVITARLAMRFGREVFDVPGNVTQEVSLAPNRLIKQGAKLVSGTEDLIEELPGCPGAGGGGRIRAARFARIEWAKSNREKDLRTT